MKNDEIRAVTLETALTIAAERLYYFGHCRYESGSLCKKKHIPTKAECIDCIRKGLLSKARAKGAGR